MAIIIIEWDLLKGYIAHNSENDWIFLSSVDIH